MGAISAVPNGLSSQMASEARINQNTECTLCFKLPQFSVSLHFYQFEICMSCFRGSNAVYLYSITMEGLAGKMTTKNKIIGQWSLKYC